VPRAALTLACSANGAVLDAASGNAVRAERNTFGTCGTHARPGAFPQRGSRMDLGQPWIQRSQSEPDEVAEQTYRETMSVLGALVYVPSATFQIVQRNFLLWTRITSHRFFEDAKRGKLQEAQILQHERHLLALGTKFQKLLLGDECSARRSHEDSSTTRTGWSSLVMGNMYLASVVHHWLDGIENHALSVDRWVTDEADKLGASQPGEAPRSTRSPLERILDALDHLPSFTERQFVVVLLLFSHVQAWSLAVKNERIPMSESGRAFVERMLDQKLEDNVLEAVRLFDVHLFKAFAVYTSPVASQGPVSWDLRRAPEIALHTQQSLGWNEIMARLAIRADEFLRLSNELYEVVYPSLRYKKPLCAKCGRAGHAPERCTFKSCID